MVRPGTKSPDQLKAAQHAQQQGLPVVVERQTVTQYLARWLEDFRAPQSQAEDL